MKNVASFAAGIIVGYKGIPLCMHVTYLTAIVFLVLSLMISNGMLH